MTRNRGGTSLGSLMASILKSQAEYIEGKIEAYLNGWIYSADGWTNRSGVHFPSRTALDGREISLVPKRSTLNCPQPPGDFPILEKGGASVPMSKCRKCPHYISRRRGKPYPSCAVLKERRKAEPSPLQKLGEVMKDAAEGVRQIMGEPHA